MPRILLVKTSSLGDVIHNLPVVTDIASSVPGARIDWIVEESYAALARLHRGVDGVLPVAIRRWRSALFKSDTWREARAFRERLRANAYDFAIDTQGLFKSAIITKMARGNGYGLGWKASREPLFPFYHRTFDVSRALHAVERNRCLASLALGYERPARLDYAIEAPQRTWPWLPQEPYAVLVHGTSAASKLWSEGHWLGLGRALERDGVRSVLPWGSDAERTRSHRLAAAMPGAIVPPRLPLDEVASLLGGARCAAGVDTGLTHLAGALDVPTLGIYIRTDPAATGLYGCTRAANVGGRGANPSVDEVVHGLRRLLG
jgi:heptosyltransferase-1